MDFKDFFITYNNVQPPERFKDTTDLEQFNFIDRPMGIIADAQTNALDFSNYSELENPFETTQNSTITNNPFDSYIPESKDMQTSNLGMKVVNIARQFLGDPYIYGSTDPNKGFDCSGLINYAYNQIGIQIPRTSHAMAKIGIEVPLSEVQPGDIIYTSSSGPSGGHVKMVSDVFNGQISVIEAKGKKWGIVESLLTNTSNIKSIRRIIDTPTSNTPLSGKFNNKQDFIRTLNHTFKEVLRNEGLDENYAYILTSSAALESGWGTRLSGSFNYGGVKSSKGSTKYTIDYIPGRGNVRRLQTFRNFNSVKDYCEYIVNLLQKDRYKSFSKYSSTQPMQFWRHTLESGYGGGSKENIDVYMTSMNKIFNLVKQG